MCISCKNELGKTFSVKNRGYGSIFDLMNFEIKLCDDCIKKYDVKEEWFTESSNFGDYKFETDIENLLQKLNLSCIDENMFECYN